MDFDLNIALGLDDFEEGEVETKDPNIARDRVNGRPSYTTTEPVNADTLANETSPDGNAIGGNSKIEEEYSSNICTDIEKNLAVGSIVDDLAKVYFLYCEYAHCKGFSVRKGDQRYVGKSKELRWKEYLCSSAGLHDCKRLKDRVAVYKKNITRTDCKAKIRVGKVFGGLWKVTIFETDHNHTLLTGDQTYLLRLARKLSDGKQSILEGLYSSGIGITRAYCFMEKESGGPQNVGFTKQDAYDHISHIKRKTKVKNGDANALLDYFINKSNEESRFYYKVQLDDDGRLMNFFFRDSRCASDFVDFGDVLSVDTTYRTNRYNLICAPFVGINHHAKTAMFGMTFLSDETTGTFEWLFKVFLESMNGKEPKVIFTDQCQALMNAADSCFPNAKHRLCQWHINQNAPSHFGSLNGDTIFIRMWQKCMNRVESEEEFEDLWSNMVNGYQLHDNKWFAGMYRLRKRWASVFTNNVFSAGLLATSRSEGTNRVLKNLCQSSGSLYDFVRNYEKIQTRWRETEHVDDTNGIWAPGQFVNGNPLLSHAASVYTRTVFKAFEKEVTSSFNVEVCEEGIDVGDGNIEFNAVSSNNSERSRAILYNKNTKHASCTCRMFECEGIFCRHILKVYYIKNVRSIPEPFILKRWTKRAKDQSRFKESSEAMSATMPTVIFANTITRCVYDLATNTRVGDSSRELLKKRVDDIRDEFLTKFGIPGTNSRCGVKSPVNSGDKFSDPIPVRQRGFINARTNTRHWDASTRKGKKKTDLTSFGFRATKKQKMNPSSSQMPKPNQYIEAEFDRFNMDPTSSTLRDVQYPWNFSQP